MVEKEILLPKFFEDAKIMLAVIFLILWATETTEEMMLKLSAGAECTRQVERFLGKALKSFQVSV